MVRLFPGFQKDSSQATLNFIASLLGEIKTSNSSIEQKIGKINIDLPRFSSTKVFTTPLVSGVITRLVAPEAQSRRTTLNFAKGTAKKVLILHGFADKPTLEDFLKSPWWLGVNSTGTDDLDGGYGIWALAIDGDATIKIGLEYEISQSNPDTATSVIMEISTLLGTGANWDDSNGWSSGYQPEINSTATGYKLFAFSDFTPGETYQFEINPGSLSFSPVSTPINVYLFELDSILKSILWRFFQGAITYSELRQQVLPIIKNKNSWAAKLPANGGNFSLTPKSTQFIGLIDGKISGELYAQTLIFNYIEDTTNNTRTFVLEGW